MDETTLSVFVDESGRFQHPDPSSRFYIVGMVFHDQRVDVSKLIEDFDRSIAELGLDRDAFVFHASARRIANFVSSVAPARSRRKNLSSLLRRGSDSFVEAGVGPRRGLPH